MYFNNAAGETLLIRAGTQERGPHGCATNHYFHQPELEAVLRSGLQRYPQVVPYVDWMASWHPYVHRIGLTEISGRLADVNRFCAAVMWGLWTPLLVPLFVVMFIRDIALKPIASIRQVLFVLIAMPLMAFVCLHATGDMDSRIGQLLAINPLGRAFFISGSVGGFWAAVYGTFIAWRGAFRRNFDF
jgi:hypothetical protein